MAERFEALLRRFYLIAREVPGRFQQWLRSAPAQKRVFATLESICVDMFPDQIGDTLELPRRWAVAVACVALKQHVLRQTGTGVELSECGGALRVLDPEVASQIPPAEAPELIRDACKAAALEIKVAQLECRLKGLLDDDGPPVRKRGRRQLPEDPAQVLAFLTESRLEAMDALAAMRRMHSSMKKQSESARMVAANAEISRLKRENEQLLKNQSGLREPVPQACVLPKRVLSLAGFWNLDPNDLLQITPHLAEAIAARGGEVVRREHMQTCFSVGDREVLVAAAVEVMAQKLPQYRRRAPGE